MLRINLTELMLSDLTESVSPLEPETVALLSMVNDVVLGAADATEPGHIRFLIGNMLTQ